MLSLFCRVGECSSSPIESFLFASAFTLFCSLLRSPELHRCIVLRSLSYSFRHWDRFGKRHGSIRCQQFLVCLRLWVDIVRTPTGLIHVEELCQIVTNVGITDHYFHELVGWMLKDKLSHAFNLFAVKFLERNSNPWQVLVPSWIKGLV